MVFINDAIEDIERSGRYIVLTLEQAELACSALHYYSTGTAYVTQEFFSDEQNIRRRKRKGRASQLARMLEAKGNWTVDEDGTGETVRRALD